MTTVAPVDVEKFVQAVFTAESALAEATTLAEVVEIRDQAEAIRQYADTARYGLKFQNLAAAFKLKAERRAGELLASLERKPGARTDLDQPPDTMSAGSPYRRTLEELKVNERAAERWQKVAKVPESAFQQFIEAEEEITTAGILRVARDLEREEKAKAPRRRRPIPAPQPLPGRDPYALFVSALAALERVYERGEGAVDESAPVERRARAAEDARRYARWLVSVADLLDGVEEQPRPDPTSQRAQP